MNVKVFAGDEISISDETWTTIKGLFVEGGEQVQTHPANATQKTSQVNQQVEGTQEKTPSVTNNKNACGELIQRRLGLAVLDIASKSTNPTSEVDYGDQYVIKYGDRAEYSVSLTDDNSSYSIEIKPSQNDGTKYFYDVNGKFTGGYYYQKTNDNKGHWVPFSKDITLHTQLEAQKINAFCKQRYKSHWDMHPVAWDKIKIPPIKYKFKNDKEATDKFNLLTTAMTIAANSNNIEFRPGGSIKCPISKDYALFAHNPGNDINNDFEINIDKPHVQLAFKKNGKIKLEFYNEQTSTWVERTTIMDEKLIKNLKFVITQIMNEDIFNE